MNKKPRDVGKDKQIPGYCELPESRVNFELGTQKVVGLAQPEGFTLMRVWVRSRASLKELDAAFNRMAEQTIRHRRYFSHAQLIERFGASPKDMDAIEDYVAQFKICVKLRDHGMQMLELWGRRGDFSQAFKINWIRYRGAGPNGQPLGRIGPIYVPKHLREIITRVTDWNDPHTRLTRLRPHGASNSRLAESIPTRLQKDLTRAAWTGKLLAQYYHLPTQANGKQLDGKGQTIALIELGQGYSPEDVGKFFNALDTPPPIVVAASNDSAKNSWQSTFGEVITDIDVVGAVVPKARLVVYFGERASADELFEAVSMAVFDDERKPSVISISWGWAENKIAPYIMNAMSELFKKAALLGITICVATGDYGSLDFAPGSSDAQANVGKLNVDFPACLEASLACGGTWIRPEGEVVWNEGTGTAGGGGISAKVPRPAYQNKSGVPRHPENKFAGRGIPDVAAIAVNHTVVQQGKAKYLSGTSFVAPFWAGLVARLNQAAGKPVGFLNPILYKYPHTCKSITKGHNDIQRKQPPFQYSADNGWDASTGLGVPVGHELFKVIMEQNR